MEIEAKFAVPDVATFQQLQAVQHVAGFALSAHQVQQVSDTYLDTEERLILASGYACRWRETEAEVLLTLKGLGKAEGAIHRRRELEISLVSYVPPEDWPESPVRDLVLQMTDGAPLVPLFDLRQTRVFRRMTQGELLVAQLSLDNVRIVANRRRKSHFELEVELAPQGTANDMRAIVTYLQDQWNLAPEPCSKFERALAFLDEDGLGGELLTAQERAICVQLAKRNDLYGLRARGLLLLDEGVSAEEAARRADRTPRTINRWLTSFKEKRISLFPDRAIHDVQTTPAAILPGVPAPARDESEPGEASPSHPEPQPLRAIVKRYLLDEAHTRCVADRALTLFDELEAYHDVPSERRTLLETAVVLHDIGSAADSERHPTAGHEILLRYPPEELNEEERLMMALITYMQGEDLPLKKLTKNLSRGPFGDLPKRARGEALALSALVRMADGLDYSQTQSSKLARVVPRDDLVDVEVSGPYAAIDAGRAQEKSDLWCSLFQSKLRFLPEGVAMDLIPYATEEMGADATIDLVPDELPEHPDVCPEDAMGEAARKILTFHFQHMLFHEPGTRAGDDIEELHDMRVATRRMRAAFRVFDDYVDGKRLKPMRKGARRTCSKLGSVRDLDVFWKKTEDYLNGLPPERRGDLMPLREAWEEEREQAREEMLSYLDGERYARFKERTAELLQPGVAWERPTLTKKGEAVPHRVRHVVPMAVYERAAAVLAYDEWVTQSNVSLKQLHRLRIAGKRLRYTLEFFQESLAPQTGDLIGQMKRLQDHLGDLQDAVVASELLRDFLTWGTWGRSQGRKSKPPKDPVVAPGVAAYMASRQAELEQLLSTFPEVWSFFRGPEFKQTVAVVVAPL